jgi:hypothetical protein
MPKRAKATNQIERTSDKTAPKEIQTGYLP